MASSMKTPSMRSQQPPRSVKKTGGTFFMHSPVCGFAALAVVFAMSLFVIAGLALTSVYVSASRSRHFGAEANHAQFLAETGIEEGLLRLARNQYYAGGYILPLGDGAVALSVVNSGGTARVTATGTVTFASEAIARTILALVTLDAEGNVLSVTKTNQ